MGYRQQIFHVALENVDLAMVPKLGGWTRTIAEIEEHRVHGGKIYEGGCFQVQSSRKPDNRIERAIDLFACLPQKKRSAALIFAHYCNPWMLEEYTGLVREIRRAGLRITPSGWVGWTRQTYGESGAYVRAFWKRVAEKRAVRDIKF